MRIATTVLLIAIASSSVFSAQPDNPKFRALGPLAGKVDHRLIPWLDQIRQKKVTPAQAAAAIRAEHGALLSKTDKEDQFLLCIDCVVDKNIVAAVKASGANVQHVSERWNTIAVTASLDQVETLSGIAGIRAINLQYAPRRRTQGAVDNHADIDEKADQLRALYNVSGVGQKIGVLSDTVNRSAAVGAGTVTGTVPNAFLSATKPQTKGELPASLQVVDFGPTSGTDEGEGMLELIYDIAPGAQLAFGSAYNTEAQFAANIIKLQQAGCTLIVDDVGYFAEPMFQDGPIAQAIKTNFQQNVLHFSAAGNDADPGVIGVYTDSNPAVDNKQATPDGSDFHDWGIGGATPTFLPISIPAGRTVYIVLQWDQPFSTSGLGAGSQADLDLYLYRSPSTSGRPAAKSTGPQGVAGAPSGDPVEVLQYTSNKADTLYLAMDHYDGVRGNRFRLSIGSVGLTFPGVPSSFFNSGTCYGHPTAKECVAVGAIFYGDVKDNGTQGPDTTNVNAEYFSSKGGIGLQALPFYFDTSGNPLPYTEYRDKPDLAACDGTNTSVFGNDSSYDADSFPNFYGTSAAAPNATAVAALLMERFPGLKPIELLSLLRGGARDIIANDPVSVIGPDDHTGAGLVDALKSGKTSIWSGIGSDNNFSTGPNWIGNTAPSAGDNLFFKGTTRPTPFNNAAASYGSIIFATSGFTINGSPLTLTNVFAVNNTSGINAVNVPVTLGNFTVFKIEPSSVLNFGPSATIDNAGFALTVDSGGDCSFAAGITGSGSLTVRSGIGNVTLSGASTYTGGTTVSAGTLFVNNSSGSGTGSGSVTLNGRSSLRGTGIISGALNCNSATSQIWPGTTTLTSQAPGTLTAASATLAVGSKLTVRVANSVSGATPQSDVLALSGSGNVLSLASGAVLDLALNVASGTYSNQYTKIVQCTGSGNIQNAFAAGSISSNKGWPITGISVVYLDASNNEVDPTVTPAKSVALKFDGIITPVTLESFTAKSDGPGVAIEWHCAGEVENLGFNLFRRPSGSEDACWAQVNSSLIAGRLTTSEPTQYRYYDWLDAGSYAYRLESISVRGEQKSAAPVVAVDVQPQPEIAELESLDAIISSALTDLSAARHEQASRRIASENLPATISMIKNAGAKQRVQSQSQINADTASVASREKRSAATDEATKVVYSGRGVLLVPQTSLPVGYNVAKLNIQREGRSVNALSVTPSGLLLFAAGYEDEYTDKDAFFLRQSSATTVSASNSLASGLFNSALPATTTTSTTVTQQFYDVFYDWGLSPYDYPPWFSSQYLTSSTTQQFGISAAHANSDAATLTVQLWSLTAGAHSLSAFVNGAAVGSSSWTGGNQALAISFQIPSGILKDGSNAVELFSPESADTQISFLHSLKLTYTRRLEGPEQFEFDSFSSGQLFEISNLPAPGVWVVDVQDGDHAQLLATETTTRADGAIKARFISKSGGKVLIVPKGSEITPTSVALRQIKALPVGIKYLATGPAQFSSAIAPLIDARQKDGLLSRFVDQESIFDYYGFGRYGPEPIRAAVRELKPDYLLLVGRTTYDYRDRNAPTVDPLCPTFLAPTTYLWQTASDSMFGDFGAGPLISVGRFPANNPAELSIMVQHTLAYQGVPLSGETALIVADRFDPAGGDFASEAESIVNSAPDLSWSKAYLGVNYATAEEITAQIQNATHNNVDLITYVGHGNSRVWGLNLPRILTVDDVMQWSGSAVLLQATCNGNWITRDEQDYHSIVIQGMCQPQGGIVASISTSTYMESKPAIAFMQTLLKSAASDDCRWGQVLLKTQQWAFKRASSDPSMGSWFGDLAKTESLLGDPALRVYRKLAPAPKSH